MKPDTGNQRTPIRTIIVPAVFAVFCACNGSTDSFSDAADTDDADVQETLTDAEDTTSDPMPEPDPDVDPDEVADEDAAGDMDEDTEPVDPCLFESDGECPPSGFTATAECEEDGDDCTCVLSGTYTDDLVLTPDVTWVLSNMVAIGDEEAGDGHAATLTILPGTTILGESASHGMLVIKMHSRIMAQGEPECPIVFTSDRPAGSRTRVDWGGITINGRAPVNLCPEPPCLMLPTGKYGGDVEDDDSGILRYVRIEFAGPPESITFEYNGLSLWAVGSGTTLEYLQIHMAGDDGIEFFGGTVDFRHVLVTGAAEDGLDWVYGWQGRGQFFISQQYDDEGSGGIDGTNSNFPDFVPRSHPVLSNLTLSGSVPEEPDRYRLGIDLSAGTAGNISCAVVLGRDGACLDIDDAETYDNAWDEGENALSGELTLNFSVMSCEMSYVDDGDPSPPFTLQEFYETLNPGNELAGTSTDILTAPFDYADPGFTPVAGGPAASGCTTPDDSFFESVTYRGGMGPDGDWTAAWTTSEMN